MIRAQAKDMKIDLICKIVLIVLYSMFSIIRIEYYRRVRKIGYKTVIEEKKRYSVWLSIFICYEVSIFFVYIFYSLGTSCESRGHTNKVARRPTRG